MQTLCSQPDQKEALCPLTSSCLGLRIMVNRNATAAATESPDVPMSMLRRFSFMATRTGEAPVSLLHNYALLLRGRWQNSIQPQIHRSFSVVVGPTAGENEAEPCARNLLSAETFGGLA